MSRPMWSTPMPRSIIISLLIVVAGVLVVTTKGNPPKLLVLYTEADVTKETIHTVGQIFVWNGDDPTGMILARRGLHHKLL